MAAGFKPRSTFYPIQIIMKTALSRYEIFCGSPSWHQRKAGHGSAGSVIGYYSEADLAAFVERYRQRGEACTWQEKPQPEDFKNLAELERCLKELKALAAGQMLITEKGKLFAVPEGSHKKTTELKPGDVVRHAGRQPEIIVSVQTEPLPCVVATVTTDKGWFMSGIEAWHCVA